MKQNIIHLAFEDSLDYLINLNVPRYFENILKRHITYHSRWYSNQKHWLKTSIEKYGLNLDLLDVMDNTSPLNLTYIEERIKKEKKYYEQCIDEQKKWKDIERCFHNILNESIQDNMDVKLDELSQNAINLTSSEIKNLNEKYIYIVEVLKKHIENLEKFKNNQRNVFSELKSMEDVIFKLVFKNYINFVQKKLQEVFQTPNVYVYFDFKSLSEEIERKKNHYYERDEEYIDNDWYNSNLTTFENYILKKLYQYRNRFKIKVIKNDKVFRLNLNKYFSFSIKNLKNNSKEHSEKIHELQKQINTLRKKYPAFDILLKFSNKLDEKSKPSLRQSKKDYEVAQKFISQVIWNYLDSDVINEYNTLVNKLKNEIELRQNEEYSERTGEIALKEVMETFNHLNFDIKVVQDMNMKILLKEEVFNNKVSTIESENYILALLSDEDEEFL